MNHPDPDTLKRAEEAHYFLQSAVFLTGRCDLPGVSLFSADAITDPEWNHASLVDLEAAGLSEALEVLRRHYRARGLPAAVMVSPFSKPPELDRRLRELGYLARFRHTWHFVGAGPVPPVELPAKAEIRPVEREQDMRHFIEVFHRVYSVDLETGRPERLCEGYRNSLMASFRGRHDGLDVVHYLALVDGTSAGVATSIHAVGNAHRGVTGLYNLAVLPRFRRCGLGAALVRRRAADALARSQSVVFLQTERESVERRLVRHGFVKGMTTTGFVERS